MVTSTAIVPLCLVCVGDQFDRVAYFQKKVNFVFLLVVCVPSVRQSFGERVDG